MASLTTGEKIIIRDVFRRVVEVGDGKDNLGASDWVWFAVTRWTACTFDDELALTESALEANAPADLRPFFRVTLSVLRADWHGLVS